jgi:hypothetical protein
VGHGQASALWLKPVFDVNQCVARISLTVLSSIWLHLALALPAWGQERLVDVYLFWQRGCPHCEQQIRTLAAIESADPAVRVHYLELGHAANRRAYTEAARALGITHSYSGA